MTLKRVGIALCLLALVSAWWVFSPSRDEDRQNVFVSSPISVRPLHLNKSSSAAMEPIEPIRPHDQSSTETASKGSSQKNSLSNEEIADVLSQYQRQFQNCWMQRLKDQPNLKGKVTFRLTLSPRGKVSDTQLVESEIQDALMLQCLNSTLSRIPFREFQGDPIEILFPLEFE